MEQQMLSTTLMRIKSTLDFAGISTTTFSQIVGVPNSTLADAFSGRRYLGAEKEAALLTKAVRVAAIARAIQPLVFEKYTGVAALKALVESGKEPEDIRSIISLLGVNGE